MHVVAAAISAAALAGFSPLSSGPDGGRVLTGTIPGTPRPACVYLPPGFAATRRYPVVYLLHGLPGSPAEYVWGTELAAFADAGIAAGTITPFIAVMPAAGTTAHYGGEWAGQWERELVADVVPWTDANLPADRSRRGRVLAGLSAGGFGAIDIALHHPGLFGAAESWSGYFVPLRDGPFEHADATTLDANDPVRLVRRNAARLRADGMRFFVSTGPAHSRRIATSASLAFARELSAHGLPVRYRSFPNRRGQWSDQLDAGLGWALATKGKGSTRSRSRRS